MASIGRITERRGFQNDPFGDRELVAYLEKPTCKTLSANNG